VESYYTVRTRHTHTIIYIITACFLVYEALASLETQTKIRPVIVIYRTIVWLNYAVNTE